MPWSPDYAEVTDLRSYLRIGDTVDDIELAMAITAASRAIDHVCNRQFGVVATAEARTYDVAWSPRRGLWQTDIDDVQTTTGLVVTVAGSSLSASLYELTPLNAASKNSPWTRLHLSAATRPSLGTGPDRVQVTALWGWTAVPATIKQATLVQSARFFRRREAPFGVAGSPEVGAELRLLERADPDVAVMVRPYRRDWPMLG